MPFSYRLSYRAIVLSLIFSAGSSIAQGQPTLPEPPKKPVLDLPTVRPGKNSIALAPEIVDELAMSPKHLARLAYVGAVSISPDGLHIAYTRYIPRDPYEKPGKHEPEFEDGPPRAELHVVRLSDGRDTVFIGRYAAFSNVKWMPDSSGLSFIAKREPDKHRSLYVISLHGGEAARVLAHETDIGDYCFSPDGTRVAFVASEKQPKSEESLAKKGFKAEVYEEEHKPARLWIARIGESFGDPDSVTLEGHAADPVWSPDGTRIAVKVSPTSLIDDVYMKQKVQIVDVASRSLAGVIGNAGKLGTVTWSPDGKTLALIAAEDLNDPSEGRLLVAPATGGALRDVLPGLEGHVQSAAWQDANTLMYVADVGCYTEFGKVQTDGGERKIIVQPGGAVLSNLTLSKYGMVGAFVGTSPVHPQEVFTMRHGDASPQRVTNTNPWLETLHLAKQEVIEFEARDGLKIQGILLHPLSRPAGRRAPLIVYVHGGPEAHESNGWITNYSRPGQIAAGRGFAVFYPNYRGSTGRGVAFSKLDQKDYAGAEFDDLVDGVKHLVSMGLVDEKRVGVTGGSYGGYASAWCATKLTEHFAASVMFVGISDLVSKLGTTDIPNEMYLVHARQWPWDGHWDWYRERSPLYHAAQSRTPTLILHGKDDPRVHPSQSMELYRYLKTIGKTPVRLVLYPGEGHGNSKAAARLDYNLRMMQWFEHYLMGPGGDPPDDEIDYQLEPAAKNDKPATQPEDKNASAD